MLRHQTRFVAFLLFVSAASLAVGLAVARVRTGSAQGTGPALSLSASGLSVTMAASGSSFDPYAAYNMGLTFDPGLLAFLGASNQLGGTPPCVYEVTPGTITFSCTLLGGGTTATGNLATADFMPAGASPACAGVHLVRFGPPDNGDVAKGSYTFDVNGNAQTNAYGTVDVQIPVNGGDCTFGTSTPVVPTATPTPSGPTDTPTPCPTDTVPTGSGCATITPTPTGTATPTPIGPPLETTIALKSQALHGFAGTIDFGAVSPPQPSSSGVVVHFAKALSSADYVVLVTPVNRWCTPLVMNKTAQGFTIVCWGVGGSVDFVVLPH